MRLVIDGSNIIMYQKENWDVHRFTGLNMWLACEGNVNIAKMIFKYVSIEFIIVHVQFMLHMVQML